MLFIMYGGLAALGGSDSLGHGKCCFTFHQQYKITLNKC